MSKLFFSKMNINDEIYQVYEGKIQIDDLLNEIYKNLTNKDSIHEDDGARYKLFDIDKLENNIIQGRLGYIKPGVHSSYDPDKDTAIDIEDKNKMDYITFYFDVQNEMFVYTITPVLTKKRVLLMLESLIKRSTGIGVKFVMEANMREVNQELRNFHVLKKVILDVVPPNGDKNEFASLFSLNAETVAESGATSIKQQYSTRSAEGINKESKLIKNAKDGISLGYAEGEFLGVDIHGEIIDFKTTKSAPYTKTIRNEESKSKSIISEKARAGISSILSFKASIRERNKHGEVE